VSGGTRFTIPTGLVALAIGVVSCTTAAAPPGILIEDAWARPAADPGGTTAAYFRIRNTGDETDRLLGAETSAAQSAELHRTSMEGDVVHMMPASALDLPPGETVVLEPGGLHLMLVGLGSALQPGDHVLITLAFERAGDLQVEVEVREP
jgi:copper(I)-binding protein